MKEGVKNTYSRHNPRSNHLSPQNNRIHRHTNPIHPKYLKIKLIKKEKVRM